MNATTSITTPKPEKKEILPNAIYLTDEAAALLGVMPATIRAAVRRGTIRGQGRPFRIRGSELFKLA